ncbi:WS/DGAT/MGAT family O-acyltransferase [Ilumatobacter coccineus]|uniref:Diacylglycerol O-acyltransferase n=1 Tax=Ilumatobacter coccineus (strain NBRC 103263 / KCTC 29153 / YM16-304) TaxID=1313172 RepID=A0A6C7EBH0_ILUCY|nr:wax ester/triacylglycerol synthase family O-acyltransferase [Ilumatobacter coccineus]BAN03730.1 wax ester synthase/diacylglycerol acyltransferase [Ilumatobacter coccineus YM16-304]
MKQLTGLDVSFLVMETPTTYGHVNGLSIYERPSDDFDPFTEVRKRLSIMVDHLEPLRRKLVEVPFELDRPYWIEDADFDIDFHVRHLGLAPPGATDQLAEQVARIVGRKMDRSRPLWEAYVIEGLADGRWALLQKTHHATIDGASGVIMLKMFTEDSPDEVYGYEHQPWVGEEPPSRAEMLQRAARNLALNPLRGVRLGLSMVRDVADAAGVSSVSGAVTTARKQLGAISKRNDPSHATETDGSSVMIPLTPAPPTPWNHTVTPHRRFAMRSMQLSNLKRLKEATGGTLNDVVMAICAGALREYLIRHEALPDDPLRAMVPVSIRTGKEEDPWTNRVSAIVAELPTNCADPLERVGLCRDAMQTAKRQFELVPAEALAEATTYTSPVIAASAARLMQRLKFADRINTPINVVISNVPGPRQALYFAGAKLDAYIPVSTISDGVGLNITVHSYEDRMDFGLISDRELVPDLWDLVDLHIEEIHRLFEATGADWAEEPLPPTMRQGGDGVAAVPPRSQAKKAATKKTATKKTATKKAATKKTAAKKTVKKKSSKKS